MKAIILAAGRGTRMGTMTEEAPKCMVEFAGKRLIDWQMSALIGASISELGIVTGYKSDQWKIPGVTYFKNTDWASTNMVMSLYQAREWLNSSPCVISYSDIVYSSKSVETLLESKAPITIAYDPNWLKMWKLRFSDPLEDAETFKLDSHGQLIEIGKRASDLQEIEGQYMGLLLFRPEGWRQVERFLSELDAIRRNKLDMTALLNALLQRGVPIDVKAIAERWYEVDSESDLNAYTRQWLETGKGDIFASLI
jgi:L-glutamine-phosphate cytidylyltransferase